MSASVIRPIGRPTGACPEPIAEELFGRYGLDGVFLRQIRAAAGPASN